MSKKQAPSKTKARTQKAPQAVVLFGLDENGKQRAAKFVLEDQQILSKLARALGLRIGLVSPTKDREILEKLPVGRIHASGGGSIPTISQALYDALNVLAGGDLGPISNVFPKSWADLAPGHLVLAHASAMDGWFESIITKCGDDNTLSLRWRDDPHYPEFTRPVAAVALLNPDAP